MKLFTSLILTLFTLPAFADSAQSCFQSTDNFYQCIEDYIKSTLPNTQWCRLSPVNHKDNSEGLVLMTLMLSDDNRFQHYAYFLGPSQKTKQLNSASGRWDLSRQLVSISYDLNVANNFQILPNEIFVDFADDEQGEEVLLLSSTIEKPNFNSIEFIKCNSIAWFPEK